MEGYIRTYRLSPNLPPYLSQVLIGLLLSDGSLERPSQEGGVRFSLNLSFDNISLFNMNITYLNLMLMVHLL